MGWSIAWRVLNAQFWGVPQARRRIALIADFGGHTAPEILFVRQGVCGAAAACGSTQENPAARAESNPHPAVWCLQGNAIDRSDTAGCNGKGWKEGIGYTLNTIDRHGVCILQQGIARRLTPLEWERLQGFPDNWTDIGAWTDGNGKVHEKCSDHMRYKALGNSIAIPPWTWVLTRLCAQYRRPATMASLFDGIGGFPLIWERHNGKGSCLWVSEIEPFPIAVTKYHFSP